MKHVKLLLIFIFVLQLTTVYSQTKNDNYYNITDYGAIGDSLTKCTKAIQRAIDVCSKNGGGTVHISSGVYMTGMLVLKDNVVLDLNAGSELRAIPDVKEFPDTEPNTPSNFNIIFRHALIYAEDAKNIGIIGQGTINGQGQAEAFKPTTLKKPDRYQNRPSLLRIVNCNGVRLENIRLINSGFWTVHLMASHDVVVQGISLYSRTANYNNDGIDIDGCENVRISDCYINSLDDAISIKATGNKPVRNIMINNCMLSSHCNAIRMGAENFAGFEDVHFSNCHIFESANGITFQNIDGFPMKRISFKGISFFETGIPIHVITGRKSYPIGVPEEEYPCPPKELPASIEDLVFDNITGSQIGYYKGAGVGNDTVIRHYRNAIILSGHENAPLIRCTMSNIFMHFNGGGTMEDSKVTLPEVNNMPNPSSEPTPVYGIIARNTENLLLTNIKLSYQEKDVRPAIAIENSTNAILKSINVHSSGVLPVIQYYNSIKPYIENCTEFFDKGEMKVISEKNGNVKNKDNFY